MLRGLVAKLLGLKPLEDLLLELRRQGRPGVLVVEHRGSGVPGELEYIAEAARWRLEERRLSDWPYNGMPEPRITIAGYRGFEYYGGLGDLLQYIPVFYMRVASGWRPASCPRVESVRRRALVYVTDGVPCVVAADRLSALAACTGGLLEAVYVNVLDYARVSGRLPVDTVPAILVDGRLVYRGTPRRLEDLAKAIWG